MVEIERAVRWGAGGWAEALARFDSSEAMRNFRKKGETADQVDSPDRVDLASINTETNQNWIDEDFQHRSSPRDWLKQMRSISAERNPDNRRRKIGHLYKDMQVVFNDEANSLPHRFLAAALITDLGYIYSADVIKAPEALEFFVSQVLDGDLDEAFSFRPVEIYSDFVYDQLLKNKKIDYKKRWVMAERQLVSKSPRTNTI